MNTTIIASMYEISTQSAIIAHQFLLEDNELRDYHMMIFNYRDTFIDWFENSNIAIKIATQYGLNFTRAIEFIDDIKDIIRFSELGLEIQRNLRHIRNQTNSELKKSIIDRMIHCINNVLTSLELMGTTMNNIGRNVFFFD